ncbi:PucR family transcriptional regulator ligand-binding domain-containing protein [Pseudonocardia sp. DSM 110487]|uniref:PucR family transcriptional regulator n=1 Tax=Pseudonocardia sp. DSM 110487 TaxID=2865833 RepID=UPI001C698FD9|nr:PucR family transcriptional regulator [Pseudonocardia sp. DSM 110487]QYN39671.1 PucR family transcriptional regulator ligand-binding domain-containing protein [Pseudonocardia sp. DSM 110487]
MPHLIRRNVQERALLTLADLVADPALRLAVVAGRDELGREIEAAAVSELAEPGPWLQGGELLLTIGLLLDESDGGCAAYVAGLLAAGVRALGLGLGADLRYQSAPPCLIRAADDAGLPLLTVPDGVPFIAVTKAVFAWRAREERRQLEWALHTQRALTAAAVQPGGLTGIIGAYERATGRAALVVDLLERPIASSRPGHEALVADFTGMLARVRAQGLLGAAVDATAGSRREVHPLGSRRLRAWLLVAGPADRVGSNLVTGDLVSLLSLELERVHGLGATRQRDRAQVLARLARGTVDDLVATRWLDAAGLPGGDLQAAVVAAPHAVELAADIAGALPDALTRVVEVAEESCVELAVPVGVDLTAVLGTLAPARPAGIGIGVRPGALVVSLRQARSALPESRITGRHVHAADIASSRQLLATVPADRLQGYADAVLGPLDAGERSAELVRTLTAFLEHNGHWEAAAAALQVHRHTVRNRIATVEELTGRRLASAHDRQELWLALRARDLARTSDS